MKLLDVNVFNQIRVPGSNHIENINRIDKANRDSGHAPIFGLIAAFQYGLMIGRREERAKRTGHKCESILITDEATIDMYHVFHEKMLELEVEDDEVESFIEKYKESLPGIFNGNVPDYVISCIGRAKEIEILARKEVAAKWLMKLGGTDMRIRAEPYSVLITTYGGIENERL